MSEVRRWAHTVTWEGLQISAAYMAINDGGEYVMHADYVALEAECERLRQQLAERDAQLLAIASAEPSRHTIEWAKAMAATGNNEAYAKWREAFDQRDKLAGLLRGIEVGISKREMPTERQLDAWFDQIDTALSELTP